MFRLHPLQTVLLMVLAVALFAPPASVAQGFPDRDTREIGSYVLTEAGLAKYTRATQNLGAIEKKLAGDCDDEEESPQSLDESVAQMNAIPEARAAITSAGMTTREYIVFTWSLFQNGMAAWTLSQPGGSLPPGTSMANVDFYRAHEAALQKLSQETVSDACEDDGSEEVVDE